MMPISLPPETCALIRKGKVVAKNVGAPPTVSIRVYIGPEPFPGLDIRLGEVPDLEKTAVIGAAVTADGKFVDLVWIDDAALAKEVKQ